MAFFPGSGAVSLSISNKIVYAMTSTGEILVRRGISQSTIAGSHWTKIPGAMHSITGKYDPHSTV